MTTAAALVDEAVAFLVDEDTGFHVMLDVAGQGAGHRVAQRQQLNVAHLHKVSTQLLQHLDAVAGRARVVGALDAVAQIRPLRVVRAAQFDVRREAARRHDAASLAVFVHKDFGRAGVQHHVHVVVAVDVVHVGLEEASAQRFNRLVGARPQTAGDGEQPSGVVLELHAQIHQPLHTCPRVGNQRVHQDGIALVVAAGERLGVVPIFSSTSTLEPS